MERLEGEVGREAAVAAQGGEGVVLGGGGCSSSLLLVSLWAPSRQVGRAAAAGSSEGSVGPLLPGPFGFPGVVF